MNCVITDNYLSLPIGTKLYIKQKGIVEKQINLFNGSNQNVFFAVFDENDVDFEICCDNQESDNGIRMKLTINQKIISFYIRPQKLITFKALETNGRKLHFISQNSNDGRVLVSQTAQKYGISYDLMENRFSRIKFAIDVEECKNKVRGSSCNSVNVSLVGSKIILFIKALIFRTYTIEIGSENTVNDLKIIIAKKEGIPPDHQGLIFGVKQLKDDKELKYYHIFNGSTIHVILSQRFGGNDPPPLTEVTGDKPLSVTDKKDSHNDSLSEGNTEAYDSNGPQLFSGERGVICYGEQSNQQFESYNGFIKDYDIEVNSFVIEMRMQSILTPI